jgi:2-hydroxy-6-oxonona-2,4-dienedioate hydrolase
MTIPDGFQSRWTGVGGVKMHAQVCERAGPSAAAVVLVHGIGLSGRYLMPLAEQLAKDFRVYVPDLPGFGQSQNPDHVLDLPELADALAAWVRAEELGAVAFLGNSFGCQVIVELAVRHPGVVDRLVLQGPTADRHARTLLRQVYRAQVSMLRYEPLSLRLVICRDWLSCGFWRLLQTGRILLRHEIHCSVNTWRTSIPPPPWCGR